MLFIGVDCGGQMSEIADRSTKAHSDQRTRQALPERSPPRVLIVEDEPLIGFLLRDCLTELGCETVGPAKTVSEALALIDGGRLDGAILDVSLADGDCTPVVAMLQARAVPFVLASGRSQHELITQCEHAAQLTKPYDYIALRAAIESLLSTHPK
jgi:DNA-binding response OmpR family regulator